MGNHNAIIPIEGHTHTHRPFLALLRSPTRHRCACRSCCCISAWMDLEKRLAKSNDQRALELTITIIITLHESSILSNNDGNNFRIINNWTKKHSPHASHHMIPEQDWVIFLLGDFFKLSNQFPDPQFTENLKLLYFFPRICRNWPMTCVFSPRPAVKAAKLMTNP